MSLLGILSETAEASGVFSLAFLAVFTVAGSNLGSRLAWLWHPPGLGQVAESQPGSLWRDFTV